MHPSFRFSEEASPELIQFLSKTILGTNGAQYQHLDTEKRIQEMENPLHISFIRNEKILGNISFARRGKNWYLRYFAFDTVFQGKGELSSKRKKNSFFKKELNEYFASKIESGEVDCFYAYIDPTNDKSKVASLALGFNKVGELFTQTFSRIRPKISSRFSTISNSVERDAFIYKTFKNEAFFHKQLNYERSYCLKNNDGEIIGFANACKLQWIIHRLPGRFGKALVHIIPLLPIISSIIRPKHHKFTGVDHVWVKDEDPQLLEELFSGILKSENQKMIVWWTDKRVLNFTDSTRWGIMHALLKNNPVDLFLSGNQFIIRDLKYHTNVKDFS